MDPNETLRRWRQAVARGAKREARDLRTDLKEWLVRGGFEPRWASVEEYRRVTGFSRDSWEDARHNPSDTWFYDLVLFPFVVLGGLYTVYTIFKPPVVVVMPSAAAVPPSALSPANHDAIREVQMKLRDLDFLPIEITGEWDHDTNYAIARFQWQEGLVPANGVLNGATAARLVAVYERKTGARQLDFAAAVYSLFLPVP